VIEPKAMRNPGVNDGTRKKEGRKIGCASQRCIVV